MIGVSDAVVIADRIGRIEKINLAAASMTGWTQDDARGRLLSEVVRLEAANDGVGVDALAALVVEGRGPRSLERGVLVARDGSRRAVAGTLVPILDGCAAVTGLLLTMQDRTAEALLTSSERRFSTLFQASPFGAALVRLQDMRFADANPALLEMLGYSRGEFVGRTADELGLWAAPEEIGLLVQELVRAGRLTNAESALRSKSGKFVNVLFSAETLHMDGRQFALGMVVDITARKRAEETQRESAERYRLLFETSADGVLLTAPDDGRILRANPSACSMLGRTEEELQRIGRQGVMDPGDERLGPALEERERAGHVQAKLRMVRKDGSKFVADITSTIFLDCDRNRRTSMFIRDVTEHEQMAAALRASEEQFRQLFHCAPFSAVLFRMIRGDDGEIADLEVQDVNKRGADDIARSAEAAIGKTASELIGLRALEPYLQVCRRVVASGHPEEFETSFVPNGREYLCSAFRVGADSYATVAVDITERKRLEAERDRLVSAIAQADEMVVITDASGTINYVNPVFETVTGYSPREAIGRNAGFLKAGEAAPAFYHNLWETITRGDVWRGQFVNRKKDGTRYVEEATISPVRDVAGAITNFVAVKRDMTRELSLSAQLRQAQRMESVGQLAGGIAHDFNNMLTVILGRTDLMLAAEGLPAALREDLLEVREAGARASEITRQLLAFARKQPISPSVLNLNAAVQSTLKMLRRLIGESIELEWRPAEQLWPVFMDRSQVDQTLMNLAVNARDAIQGAGRITIQTANVVLTQDTYVEQAKPGDYVVVSVRDSGHGMAPSVLEHVFEPFFTTKPPGEGTGLGLATVYGIVKQNGGFVNAYSELGQGTIFRIYIPRYIEGPLQEPVLPKQEQIRGGGETVLLVEDEEMILEFARIALEQLGYLVLATTNPTEALRLFAERGSEVRLLVTDVVMPEMTGRDLAHRLRAAAPALKVLYMSGYPAERLGDGIELNGSPLLQKPFSSRDLALKVRELLDRA